MRLIQFHTRENTPRVAIVEGERVRLVEEVRSVYELAMRSEEEHKTLESLVVSLAGTAFEPYERIITEKRILVPLSHPDPYHVWITGTGLTHLGSAASRDSMHKDTSRPETDSMKMFRMGMENGKMNGTQPASQPEWFFKGNGLAIVHPEQSIPSPPFALDGGEEPEVVGLYVIGNDRQPHRVGFALGNEFSDHKMERINYLYLAHSKLRHCSFGPELLISELPNHIEGISRILRKGKRIWEKPFLTGEKNMSHNIANLEHHHFKYAMFRQPGDVHVHFFGTSVLSFTDGIHVQNGDTFEIESATFGEPLRNDLMESNLSDQA